MIRLLAAFCTTACLWSSCALTLTKNVPQDEPKRLFNDRVSINSGRLIGGTDVVTGQFPFAAAINVQTSSAKFFCTGAFAGPRWIITSGNCVNGGVLFTVRLGSVKLNGPDALVVTTSAYAIHPAFDANTIKGDIGMIYFQMDIGFTDFIQPLYTYDLDLDDIPSFSALGWGQTSDANSQLSNNLQYVNVTLLPNAVCRVYYGNQITENMACVEGQTKEGLCIGDNGGPLFMYTSNHLGSTAWIVGVASFVSGNGCESAEPSGYTRIAPYLGWIDGYLYGEYDDSK